MAGGVANMWGYSDLLVGMRSWVARFAISSLVGGLVGALLLLEPPSQFDVIVPWLVLGATLVFIVQKRLTEPSRDLPDPSYAGSLV